ncbi:MAG: hypothetical protein ACYCW6_27585, partial [Candidatus Xenobia bacterium]
MQTAYAPMASIDFNRQLHQRLGRLARDVRRALGPSLHALVLGGGYGRGEGGVVRQGDGEAPYNDLDLALILEDSIRPRLFDISDRYQAELGVHVDFSRPLLADGLDDLPPYLVWYDLALGHVVLDGPSNVLERLARRMRGITLDPAE